VSLWITPTVSSGDAVSLEYILLPGGLSLPEAELSLKSVSMYQSSSEREVGRFFELGHIVEYVEVFYKDTTILQFRELHSLYQVVACMSLQNPE
jgi:hypothetical protein